MPGEIFKAQGAIPEGPFTAGEALTKGDVVYVKESDGKIYQATNAIIDEPKYAVRETYASAAADVVIYGSGTHITLKAKGSINPGALLIVGTTAAQGSEFSRATIPTPPGRTDVENVQKEYLKIVGRSVDKTTVTDGNDVRSVLK